MLHATVKGRQALPGHLQLLAAVSCRGYVFHQYQRWRQTSPSHLSQLPHGGSFNCPYCSACDCLERVHILSLLNSKRSQERGSLSLWPFQRSKLSLRLAFVSAAHQQPALWRGLADNQHLPGQVLTASCHCFLIVLSINHADKTSSCCFSYCNCCFLLWWTFCLASMSQM